MLKTDKNYNGSVGKCSFGSIVYEHIIGVLHQHHTYV